MYCALQPLPSVTLNCHCNVEVCCSPKVTKYIYRYITKGGDRAMIKVDANGDRVLTNEARELKEKMSMIPEIKKRGVLAD